MKAKVTKETDENGVNIQSAFSSGVGLVIPIESGDGSLQFQVPATLIIRDISGYDAKVAEEISAGLVTAFALLFSYALTGSADAADEFAATMESVRKLAIQKPENGFTIFGEILSPFNETYVKRNVTLTEYSIPSEVVTAVDVLGNIQNWINNDTIETQNRTGNQYDMAKVIPYNAMKLWNPVIVGHEPAANASNNRQYGNRSSSSSTTRTYQPRQQAQGNTGNNRQYGNRNQGGNRSQGKPQPGQVVALYIDNATWVPNRQNNEGGYLELSNGERVYNTANRVWDHIVKQMSLPQNETVRIDTTFDVIKKQSKNGTTYYSLPE